VEEEETTCSTLTEVRVVALDEEQEEGEEEEELAPRRFVREIKNSHCFWVVLLVSFR